VTASGKNKRARQESSGEERRGLFAVLLPERKDLYVGAGDEKSGDVLLIH